MNNRIEEQPFFHGIRTKDDVAVELKKTGDFLIRTEQFRNRTDTYLSVLEEKGLANYLLTIVNVEGKQKFCVTHQTGMASKPDFKSILDLVNFYRIMPIIEGGTRLKHGIRRPWWLVKHDVVHYNEKKDILGSGNFCTVFKGKYTDRDLRPVIAAIKVCHRDTQNDQQEVHEAEASVIREAKLMSKYLHRNIIKFLGVACDRIPVLLVMEFCPGGSLEDHLKKFAEIPTMELILYCFEIARGMRYLHTHRHKLIHRDLATRNCLISAGGVVKVGDFGLSTTAHELEKKELKMKHIPIRWMGPECLHKHPVYSLASDVWAYGVLIYEVFNKGVAPWPYDKDFKAMGKRISSYDMPKLPANTPGFIQKIVEERIWQPYEERIGFDEIFPILTDYLFENQNLFSPPQDLIVNKVPGILRKKIFNQTKPEILLDAPDLLLLKTPSISAKKSQQKRHLSENVSKQSVLSPRNSRHQQNTLVRRTNFSADTAHSGRRGERNKTMDISTATGRGSH